MTHQQGKPQTNHHNGERHARANPQVDHQPWRHLGNDENPRQGQEFQQGVGVHPAQNHSPTASAAVLVLSQGVVRWKAMVTSRFCSPSAATALMA